MKRVSQVVKCCLFASIFPTSITIDYIFTVSGPPKSLTLSNRQENSLKIVWEAPQVSNGVIQEYHVSAIPISSYSVSSVALPIEWVFSNTTSTIDLLGLQPGTQYNVSVKAKTLDGYGIPLSEVFNTEIGGKICLSGTASSIISYEILVSAPDKPEPPVVLSAANNTATIQLKPILPTHGPITAYRIIVMNEDATSIGVHKDSPLKTWAEAKSENLPFYITAELKPEVLVKYLKN